jgi:type I restriction enzyme, S subunit
MSWKKMKFGDILTESKIESLHSDPDKRITVRLNYKGVEKRPFEKGVEGGTKYYVRKAGQFIYGKQNLFKGAFGLVPKELDGYESSQDIPTFDINKKCLPEWLVYFLRQGNFYQSLENIATGTGSRRIQPARLFEVEIPLPDLHEQRELISKIHEVEKKYDGLDVELHQQQTYLQLLRQAILQEAVQGKLTKQHPTDEPASELLKRIIKEREELIKKKVFQKAKESSDIGKDEFPYELPKNWTKAKLVDLCFITKLAGFEYTKYMKLTDAGEVPVIRAQNVRKNFIDETNLKFIDLKTSKLLNRCALDTECLLITFIGAGIGDVALFNKKERWHLAPNVAKAVPFNYTSNKVDANYLCYYLLSDIGQNELFKFNKATAQPSLSMGTIRQAIVALPPLAEQQRIVAKVQKLQQQLNQLEAQVQQSRQYAQQLLQTVLKEAFVMKRYDYEENELLTIAAE